MISYYELLTMVKEDKAPKKIRVHLTSNTSKLYVREDDFGETFIYYGLLNEDEENDEYKYYLAENYFESMMFDKNIEIIEIVEDKPNIAREELEGRIDKAINFLETQHNTYPSGEKWREALKDILKGGFIIEEEKDNRLHWEQKESLDGNFNQKEKIQILARRTEKLKKCLNEIIEETPIISKLYINNELQYNLEEKKIEKCEYKKVGNEKNFEYIADKINEIIDKLNGTER